MKLQFFLLMSALVFFGFTKSSDAYVISHGKGGDCSAIGIWDADTKTCTLTGDVYANSSNLEVISFSRTQNLTGLIQINGGGITLDGNGYNVMGQGADVSIFVYRERGVTIKNVSVKNSNTAIFVSYGGNNHILNNAISQSMKGIYLGSSKNNIVSGNTVQNSREYGIVINNSSSNIIIGNIINYAVVGILANNPCTNNIINNNMVSNSTEGLLMANQTDNTEVFNNTFYAYAPLYVGDGASYNKIYNNNFISSFKNNVGWPNYTNVFNLDSPVGGNYWSSFDSSAEGCNDANDDGLCDQAYFMTESGIDNAPWATQNGWLK